MTHSIDRRFKGWSGRRGARRCAALLACIGFALVLGAVGRSADHATLAFAATTSKASFPTVSLSGPHNYRAGRHATSVAVADLNGDNKADLAVANESGTVSVLLNPGSGRFKTRRAYRAGRRPASVTIADLNGDHKPDLAVANAGASSISTLLNTGSGRFAPKRDYGTGQEPIDVASGDLNGDRRPDLVTANAESSTISVLTNEDGGSFGPKVDYQFPQYSYPSSVAISDVSGDGKADLVAAYDPKVSVFLNTGDGTFEPRRDYKSGGDPLAIADLNGDRRPDLVTGDNFAVSVLLNQADGTFRAEAALRDRKLRPVDCRRRSQPRRQAGRGDHGHNRSQPGGLRLRGRVRRLGASEQGARQAWPPLELLHRLRRVRPGLVGDLRRHRRPEA